MKLAVVKKGVTRRFVFHAILLAIHAELVLYMSVYVYVCDAHVCVCNLSV